MGGVRGDVMRLGCIQTTMVQMGQPPSVQGTDPAMATFAARRTTSLTRRVNCQSSA